MSGSAADLAVRTKAGFPQSAAIAALYHLILSPIEHWDGNLDPGLLRCLYTVGRHDLPLGRLFEGHVDALQIIGRFGSDGQRKWVSRLADQGASFGVWNADLPTGLRWDGSRIDGGKSYASGAGLLSHALVTADSAKGRQLLLIDLKTTPPDIDRTWWNMVGMQRSETHQVYWINAASTADCAIGAPDDYARDPWFSGGALRFISVQAGGIAGLFDHVRDHLVASGRAGDPHQAVRLASLYGCADLAAAAVDRAAAAWREAPDLVRLAKVAAARVQVADLGEQALIIAQQAVGLQGLFVAHPLAAAITDLMVYLRQPAPDAQRQKVGGAAANGVLDPAL